LAFWSPRHNLGFQASIVPIPSSPHTIYYWEAYAVLSAFYWILHSTNPTPRRVVIYSDNLNSVHLFSSLRATVELNPIALTAADLMLRFDCQLRVAHISGKQNQVADALSRRMNIDARRFAPGIDIANFEPPHLLLGA
ncbi:hypothetical protein M413DRAFT_42890, partial [Hebeloma cylindrosporum]